MLERRLRGILFLCSVVIAATTAQAVEYPANARVVDARDFGVVGDGVADDTAALNAALRAARPSGAIGTIVYLPDGVYRITDTVSVPEPRITLQGQSRTGTILRLDPALPAFADPATPKVVLSTREATGFSANQFRIYVNELTVEVGAGNPGAIALKLHNNNTGGMENVTLRSLDASGAGLIGLDVGGSDKGPSMVRGLVVEGFATGIAAGGTEYSLTFEQTTLSGQTVVGINSTWQLLQFRGLVSTNSVPVLRNNKATANDFRWGIVAILDGSFDGGAAGSVAIENEASLYLRNVDASGYDAVLSNRGVVDPRTTIDEYVFERAVSLFESPAAMLKLPIEETPILPDDPIAGWRNVEDFGADGTDSLDDATAIQAAIDAGGATTLYFPAGNYRISQTIQLRGDVRRLEFLESNVTAIEPLASSAGAVFEMGPSGAPVVRMAQVDIDHDGGPGVRHDAAGRDLVMAHGAFDDYVGSGSGRLFVEDAVGGPWRIGPGQQAWARQLNPEPSGVKVENDGGTLWILGLKTEKQGTAIVTRGGGSTELIGGLIYPVQEVPLEQPMFVNDGGSFSAVIGESSFVSLADHKVVVEETRGGELRRLRDGEISGRVGFGAGAKLVLYSGFVDPAFVAPSSPVADYALDQTSGLVAPDGSGNGNDGVLDGASWITDGLIGGALNFDGVDDQVDLPTGILGSQAGAVSLWFRTAEDFAAEVGHLFYGTSSTDGSANGGGSQNECHLTVSQTAGVNFFCEGSATGSDVSLSAGTGLNDGNWHHAVASWDRDGWVDLYLDGQRQDRGYAPNHNLFDFSAGLRLGRPNASSRRYRGDLDEVRLYDRPLRLYEVLDIYFGALGGADYPPAARAPRNTIVQNTAYTTTLSGQTNDDGRPSGILTSTWSTTSGPGSALFANANQPISDATFPLAGDYVLRLTADDGARSAFDELEVRVFDPLPAPWLNDDVGNVGEPGWALAAPTADAFTLNGSGNVLGGNAASSGDRFHFVYQNVDPPVDQQVVARIDSFDATDPNGRAGVMWRSSLNSVASNAFLGLSPDGLVLSIRSGSGGNTTVTDLVPGLSPPVWVRIQRTDSNVGEAAYSSDGVHWTEVGPIGPNFGNSAFQLGLAVNSGTGSIAQADFSSVEVSSFNAAPIVDAGRDRLLQASSFALTLAPSVSDDGFPGGGLLPTWSQVSGPGGVIFDDPNIQAATATFPSEGSYELQLSVDDGERTTVDTVQVEVVTPLPAPWESVSIGTSVDGQAQVAPGLALDVTGAGAGLRGSTDGLHFAHQSIVLGSGIAVTARLESLPATGDPDAQAGVSFRGSLGSRSSNGFIGVTASSGLVYSNRAGTNGGTATQFSDGAIQPPLWLQIERTGTNQVLARYSTDGLSWVDLGTSTVNVGGGTKLMGLTSSGGGGSLLGTASFSQACVSTATGLGDPDGDGIIEACDNCPLALNPAQTDTDLDGAGDVCDTDDDGDGVDDAQDCAPLDPAVVDPPLAISGVTGQRSGGDVTFSWSDSGTGASYDVIEGGLGALAGFADASCVESGLTQPSFSSEGSTIPPGSGRWVLVRAVLGCAGDFGDDSQGQPRAPAVTCD